MEGSSRMYMTPTKPEPIWLARRMRCASPPDNVSALRSRVRYPRPTLARNLSRLPISLTIFAAISPRHPGSFNCEKNSTAWLTANDDTSGALRPSRNTFLADRLSLVPWQSGQAREERYLDSSSRTVADSVSL